jgi:hypothetical protein
MSVDYSKLIYASELNAFKTQEINTTSITASGTIGAGATVNFTSTITLDENQDFAYAIANYREYVKNTLAWQLMPTFDVAVTTTPTGFINWYLLYRINGNVVTFTLGAQNPYGSTETITSTTINIIYVTYTLSN